MQQVLRLLQASTTHEGQPCSVPVRPLAHSSRRQDAMQTPYTGRKPVVSAASASPKMCAACRTWSCCGKSGQSCCRRACCAGPASTCTPAAAIRPPACRRPPRSCRPSSLPVQVSWAAFGKAARKRQCIAGELARSLHEARAALRCSMTLRLMLDPQHTQVMHCCTLQPGCVSRCARREPHRAALWAWWRP